MVDTKPRNTTLKKLAKWSPAPSSSTERRTTNIPPLSSSAPFTHVHYDKLQQGSLYIIKIKQVSLAMFEGWNDDMCCFSVLRSEVEPLRWSEARQLPGDFDIYDAFDECGNPPIHLWAKYLKVSVPNNWFSMFEEAKRKQREWVIHQQQQQQGYIRHSMIQQQHSHDPNEYYYPPLPQQPQQQIEDGSIIHSNGAPDQSNTDVSTMSLNHQSTTTESVTSPSSVVASTNIVDPSLMNEDLRSSTTSLHHQPSIVSTTSYLTNSSRTGRQQVLSPTPSYRENIQQQHSPAERSNSIMDREQIRRHLAPGQAVITNRNSVSTVTLSSGSTPLSPMNKESPKLVHHRSKEYVPQNIPEEKIDDESNVINVESNISAYSNELDFPHDSDRFSIRSDIPSSNPSNTVSETPSVIQSVSSKTRHRPSVKKIIWG